MRNVERDARAPTYARIKQAILSRIRAGDLRPGELVPGEQELAAEFGCARATAHRAMRELAEEGVLERRRRAGTRVAPGEGRGAQFRISRVDQEVAARGAEYRYALLERRVAIPPETMRTRLELPVYTDALFIRCLHYANDLPFQMEERWINLLAVPDARTESFWETGPNAWLLRRVPWSEAEQMLYAANADANEAALLGLAERDALFVVERRTRRGPQVVTSVRLKYPGRYYRLPVDIAG